MMHLRIDSFLPAHHVFVLVWRYGMFKTESYILYHLRINKFAVKTSKNPTPTWVNVCKAIPNITYEFSYIVPIQ